MSDDHKSPVDQALDLLVYAPIGLALTAAEELPRLVEKGRDVVASRASMYRMIGKYAVDKGQQKAGRFVRTRAQATERPTPPPRHTAPAPARPTVAGAPPEAPAGNGRTPRVPSSDDHLAIPGYDALSASQVVQRLAGLSADELEQVRAYETATRGRKTILSRVAQLQSGG